MRAILLPIIVLSAACKREPREPRVVPDMGGTSAVPDTGGTSATVPAAPAVRETPQPARPDPELPPPDETLGAVPGEIAKAVTLEKVAEDFARPVLVTFAPGDARRRLFVVEQHKAKIRVIEGGKVAREPFLSLEGKVSRGNEQGLLALAFHPRFDENGKLYVYYTDRNDHSHIVEYGVDASGDMVDPKRVRELLFQEQPYSNHNGGHLEFGKDGKLYFGFGDGGAAGDPLGAGQDDDTRLAKLLRIDVEGGKPTIEIIAKGLRNPWRFDFDDQTGDLYIGDVGQDKWEWVHVVAAGEIAGKNFGWNVVEGDHCYERRSCNRSKFHPPAVEYSHDEGCSITGGFVYRGKAIPELEGVYFYADYCTALVRSFRWAKDGVRQHWDWKPVLDPDGQLSQLSSFGVDADGELYLMSLSGTIWRLARR